MMKKSFAVIIIVSLLMFSFAADAFASDEPDADDTNTGDQAGCFTIKFTDAFFEDNSEFFTEDKFPLKVCAVETTNADNKTEFSIEQASACDALIRPGSGEEFWLIIKDYQDEYGQTIYIANAGSDPSISYAPDSSGTSVYTASHLTTAFERYTVLDTDLGQMKVSFYSPAGVFELGSTFFADALSGDEADALKAVIDEEYLEELEGIFMFDVGVKNKFGEKYTELSDKVKLSVSLPDGWENMDIKFIYPTDETDVELTGEIKTLSEGNMYETELEHFGSFALLVYEKPPVPVKKSTLTFDLGGGTLDGKTGKFTIEANAGDVITIPEAPTREGYTFRYWEGSEYYPGDQYTVEDDHTFTAKWEKDEVRTYTVTFDANGHGTAPAAQTVKEGEKAAKPADLSAGGYTFGGWFTDKECKTAFDFNTPITKDTALYAKWTVKSGSEGGNNGASHTSVRKSPETGDENNAGLLFMLMAASLLGMIPIVMRKMGAGN